MWNPLNDRSITLLGAVCLTMAAACGGGASNSDTSNSVTNDDTNGSPNDENNDDTAEDHCSDVPRAPVGGAEGATLTASGEFEGTAYDIACADEDVQVSYQGGAGTITVGCTTGDWAVSLVLNAGGETDYSAEGVPEPTTTNISITNLTTNQGLSKGSEGHTRTSLTATVDEGCQAAGMFSGEWEARTVGTQETPAATIDGSFDVTPEL